MNLKDRIALKIHKLSKNKYKQLAEGEVLNAGGIILDGSKLNLERKYLYVDKNNADGQNTMYLVPDTSVWHSLIDAQEYAKSGAAYEGQIITVIEGGESTPYVINGTGENRRLKAISSNSASYGEVSYSWNSGHTSCTATATCSCGSTVTETKAATKRSIIDTSTCITKSKWNYAVTFDNPVLGATSCPDYHYGTLNPNNHEGTAVESSRTNATCTTDGVINYKYSCCQLATSSKIPAPGHKYGSVVTPPTQTAQGYTTHTCSVCGHSYKDAYTDPTGPDQPEHTHSYTIFVETVARTCTTDGYTTYKCSCGETENRDIVNAGHEEVIDKAVTATCTAAGKTQGKHCSICNTVLEAQETIPATGHTEEIVAGKDATCTETGLTEGKKCSVCNTTIIEQTVISALGHSFVDGICSVCSAIDPNCEHEDTTTSESVTKAATCTTQGSKTVTVTCNTCKNVVSTATENIPALGHTEGDTVRENVINSTCSKHGSYDEVVYCTTCDTEVSRETITTEMLEHTEEVMSGKAATCTETGLTEGKKCSICGEITVAQETIHKIDHTPGDPATCTTPQTCTACGEEISPALDHNYDAVVTEPTEYEGGYTTYTCTVCGDSYIGDEKPALGHTHNYSSAVTYPTCTENGYTTYTCSCGDSYTDDETPATGHNAGFAATCVSAQTCTLCGTVLEEKNPNAHTAGPEATCTDPQVCEKCGVELSPTIDHVYTGTYTPPIGDEPGYTFYSCNNPKCSAKYYICEEHKWKTLVAPTCTDNGTKQCTRCDKTETAEALGHTPDNIGPTCKLPQLCTVCGETVRPANGHTPGPAATCTEPQNCTVCGAEIESALGHDYNYTDIDATCTTEGFTKVTCSRCDLKETADGRIPALGHAWLSTTDPTCTTEGINECTRCNATETIPALGHDLSVSTVIEPTCTAGGYTKNECSRGCGSYSTTNATAALGHTPGPDATCTEPQKCSVCGEKLADNKGHSPGPAATCTSAQTCTVCNAIIVAKKGHDYNDIVTAPTCTEQGYTTHNCKNCDYSFVDTYVDELGHSYNSVYTQPTCTADGYTTYICSTCRDSYTQTAVGTATGHGDWKVTTAPTCTETGIETCGRCNTETRIADKLGHDYENTVVSPTCIKRGYTTHTCSRCGDTYNDNYVDALGHSADITAATCTQNQTCLTCGTVMAEALGHKYTSVVTAPTCTRDGYTTHTCSRYGCGHEYKDTIVKTPGHTPGSAATCVSSQICTVCGTTLVEATGVHTPNVPNASCGVAQVCTVCGTELAAALAHKKGPAATCDSAQICTLCGTVLEEKNPDAHTPGPAATCTTPQICILCGATIKNALGHTKGPAATCTSPQTCTVCGEVIVAARGHIFINGKCTTCGMINLA